VPVNIRQILSLLGVVLVSACHSGAANSAADPASGLTPYQQLQCRYPVPPAYTGPLQIESKYDQSDASKSTLKAQRADTSVDIQRQIDQYSKQVVRFADYWLEHGIDKNSLMALACMDQWLLGWARAGALTSQDASKTGKAARKWALAALATAVWKTQVLSAGQLQLRKEQMDWFQQLAEQVIQDYSPRLNPDFAYFNNHDYWAAWAVSVTGLVLHKPAYGDWGDRILRRGLQQITPLPAQTEYAVLPNEMQRRTLALNYTHYALVPLSLLYDSGVRAGRSYSQQEQQRLQQLAALAAQAVLEPQQVAKLFDGQQQPVADYKLVWLYPFLQQFPNHRQAQQLYRHKGDAIDRYSQVGGRIQPLFAQLHSGSAP